VPKDQPTIQSAINAAINGDTALVAPGTYAENINFNGKAITVKSESGPQNTIIDGGKLGSVVTFTSGEGRDSILNGFTLQNGSAGVGGGIIIAGSSIAGSSPTITNNVITNNHACLGGGAGIWINFGSPLIQLNTITNNGDDISCPGNGGGIQVNGNSSVEILDNVISNNKVALESFGGGGIDMGPNNDGIPIIKGNVIKGNGSSTVGGGILLASPNAVVVQNLITGNHAERGGGIFLVPISQRLVNNTIADNDAADGSGIYSSFIDTVPPQPTNNLTELTNNIIVAIQAQSQGQSVLYCLNSNSIPSVIRFNNIFSANGFTFGGAIPDQTGMNGNISADPMFANPTQGDYHLLTVSPSIDSGYNQAPNLPDKDLDGDPRIVDGDGDGNAIIDMGVDEFTGQDRSLPTSTISAPTAGTIVITGTTVNITGTASDAGGGMVQSVQVSVDGGATWNVATGTTAWSYNWTPTLPGSATIKSRAIDNSGNVQDPPAQVTVTVQDTMPPTSIITSPTAGATVNTGTTVNITGIASDAGGGTVVRVEVSVDGGVTYNTATGTTTWSYIWTPAITGSATISSRAVDDSGNAQDPPAEITVTVRDPIIIRVTPGQTIQSAIASAINGDTVLVAPGTYVENIDFLGKRITVTSERGPNDTIIDGGNVAPVANFSSGESRDSTLNGFTLQNGRSVESPGPTFLNGGGVNIIESDPTITNNVITNNHACIGAGIFVGGASPLIQLNKITGNNNSCGGSVISAQASSSVEILDNVITDNVGGGITLDVDGNPIIKNNIIMGNNNAGDLGGGIFILRNPDSDVLIVQNLIAGNQAAYGGGLCLLGAGPLKVLNNTIADNDAATSGSGIYDFGPDGRTELTNNIIYAKPGQAGLFCDSFRSQNPPIIRFNNIFSSGGMAYGGHCPDMTGTNGNKSLDPLFADLTQGDYHLLQGSPSIDASYNQATNLPDKDLDGNQRVLDGDGDGNAIIDMGAYEFLAPASAVWNFLPRSPGSFTTRIPIGVGSPNLLSSISRAKPFNLDWQIIVKGSSLWASYRR
jgi:Bacterial Ig domain/Right handed beta helix region